MITTITTKRGHKFDVDEEKLPIEYKREIDHAKSLFLTGDVTYDQLVIAAERYIASIRLYGKRNNKRVPIPSVAKLLR